MRWPGTFRAERIDLVLRLATQTGHGEEDLCRALRGIPTQEATAFLLGVMRGELDQLVAEARDR